jgi:hypothetical protein
MYRYSTSNGAQKQIGEINTCFTLMTSKLLKRKKQKDLYPYIQFSITEVVFITLDSQG